MGSIRRKTGSYEARYRDLSGRSRSKSFRTKSEASAFLAQVETAQHAGTWVDPQHGRIRFSVWAEQETGSWSDLRPATRARADSLIRIHVMPEFRDRPIGSITNLHVQSWVTRLSEAGLSASTVQGCYRLLSRILASAVSARLIAASPCHDVRLPRLESKEMLFLTAEELHRLAQTAERFTTLIYSAGYLGLRWGELAGLRRGRVDLLRGNIEVVETLNDVGGHLHFGPPKTKASRRRVSVPEFLVSMLSEHLLSRPGGPEELVFVGRDGAPLRRTAFRSRHWKPAVQRAGLPESLRFHDLRHTCASLLIAQGAHPKEIQARLGHSSITTTLDRYGHLFPSLDDRLRDGLDATFRAAAESGGIES
ncbi:MAG: tyrosine-type recombinase/integrase [Actinomycetota bacterium]